MNPALPGEIEQQLAETIAANNEMPEVLREINERRYAAEREYARVKAVLTAKYRSGGMTSMDARRQAEAESTTQLEAWHQAKTEFHYAQDTARALRAAISGLQTLLKSSTSAMNLAVGQFGG